MKSSVDPGKINKNGGNIYEAREILTKNEILKKLWCEHVRQARKK